jgi:hypothetical protein
MTTTVRRLVLFIIGGLIALMMAPALGVHHLSDLGLSCNEYQGRR